MGRAQIYDPGLGWVPMTGGVESGGGSGGSGLLASRVATGSNGPTTDETLLTSQALTIPSIVPVVVDAVAVLTASNVDENEGIRSFVEIDGVAGIDDAVSIGLVSQSAHTHNSQGSTVTGTASSHSHTIAVGLHNHGSRTPSISVGDAAKSLHPIGLRAYTPPSTTVTVNLKAQITNGNPTGYEWVLKVLVFEAP